LSVAGVLFLLGDKLLPRIFVLLLAILRVGRCGRFHAV
jgi:hypothetical protein